jgi:ribose transport system ATP-binding protein
MATLLQTRGLAKAYASPVLADINFDLRAGEVHALVGENGAGKSTLCNILAGLSHADSGSMFLDERPYEPISKKIAERQGVRIVLQELSLIDNLSVAENLFLRRLPNRMGWIQGARLARAARAALDRVGLTDLDPNVSVRQLGIGQKQLVEIAAGLSQECKILILDEPTAALTVTDAKRLFVQVRKLQEAGVGIVFISHHLEEVQDIADRVSVLRDGRLVAVKERGSFSIDDIIRLMVGRDLGESVERRDRSVSGRVRLRVEKLKAPPGVRDVTFEARAGEILGIAGLMGSGRTETMRAIYGADRRAAGKIFVNGKEVQIDQPAEAVKWGIGLLTEDRKAQGLLLPKPLRMNISLARLGDEIGRYGWINRAVEEKVAESWVRRLAVRCSSAEQAARNLSGGNQQKVVLARWLYRDCDILICDEPTRGIDVGAKFEIYHLLGELAADGKAIVVVSSDLKELLALCDRIAVMSAGKLVTEFCRGEWTEDRIMSAAFSELSKTPVGLAEPNETANGGGSGRRSQPIQ